MTDQTRHEFDEMSLSVLQRINGLCNEFESACRDGNVPEIERFLERVPADQRGTLLRQLIPQQIEARRENGESPTADEYAVKYPEIERDWVQRVLDGEFDHTDGGQNASQPAADLIPSGTVIGNYEIVEHIGAGGMADVYRARHTRLRRDVALKHLKDLAGNAIQHLQRFEKEMILVAGFSHGNLVTAYDAGEHSQRPFLVTEFIKGTDLAARVRRRGPLAIADAVDYTLQAARGLAYVHDRGVVHRDVKPSNLLLDEDGCIKVADLGLARFTQQSPEMADMPSDETSTEIVMGTVDYMAPEQGRSATYADEQSDIYSLGCTLCFLLTGRPVYPGGSVMDRLHAHRFDDVPNLRELRGDVPPAVNAVFQKMIAKEPQQRYAAMTEVVTALEAVRGLETVPGGDSDSFQLGAVPLDGEPSSGVDSVALRTMQIDDSTPIGPRARSNKSRTKRGNRHRPWIAFATAGGVLLLIAILVFVFRPDPEGGGNADDPTAPPAAVVPFENARAQQEAWATWLKQPRELTERGIDFVLIPGGRFRPGSTAEQLRDLQASGFVDESPYGPETQGTPVELKPFYMSITEITFAQFQAFVRATNYRTHAERRGSGFGIRDGRWAQGDYNWRNMGEYRPGPSHPATNLTWHDAVAYCEWLTKQSGGKVVYRLPTEHEWEFAARAGSNRVWFFGDDYPRLELFAWHGRNAGNRIHPVRQLRPNPFGLYDIYGNESEWCSDRFLLLEDNRLVRLQPSDTGDASRIVSPQRGGNFQAIAAEARSAVRRMSEPTSPARGAFRIVREVTPR